jgi:hypothetical protein
MKKILCLFLLINSIVYSQVGGESIYNFLNLPSSAKHAALGGKAITILDDVNQPLWNPSLINSLHQNKLSVTYTNYLADLNLTTASYAFKVNDNIGLLHTGVTYLNYGKFVGADDLGLETGTFKAYDLAISIGYSYNFLNSDFNIGGNLKFINSVIDNYTSFGIGGDLGLLYYNENKNISFAIVFRNFGYQISVFHEEREDLPFQIDLGIAYRMENVPIKWHFTLDNIQKWNISESNPSNETVDLDGNITKENISVFNNALRHIAVGIELFPLNNFNLQLGYNFRRAKELALIDKRTFSGFSAGFGLKMRKFNFNYAFSKFHPASNSSTFSLLVNLN